MGRQPRSLSEWCVLLATAERHVSDRPGAEPSRRTSYVSLAKAMPKGMRVAEFIVMWAVAKQELGEVTTERVADFWGMNERTAYRRLKEFREVWGPPVLTEQYETPDSLADGLIAEAKRLRRKLSPTSLVAAVGWRVKPDADLTVAA